MTKSQAVAALTAAGWTSADITFEWTTGTVAPCPTPSAGGAPTPAPCYNLNLATRGTVLTQSISGGFVKPKAPIKLKLEGPEIL